MNIAVELIEITREHHLSLTIANKAINAIKSSNADKINTIITVINNNFSKLFCKHFAYEEEHIFNLPSLSNKSACALIIQLTQEHKQLLKMAQTINIDNLMQFGTLLKEHTRTEDRVLFPLLSKQDLQHMSKYEKL